MGALRAVRAAVRRAASGRASRRRAGASSRPDRCGRRWRGTPRPGRGRRAVRAGILAGGLGLVVAAYAAAAVSVRGTRRRHARTARAGALQRRQARRGAAAVPRGQAPRAALGHRHPLELLLVDHPLPQERLGERRETAFQRLLDRFPEAPSARGVDSITWGSAARDSATAGGAVAAWRETQARFPGTPWAKYAGERLAEAARPLTPFTVGIPVYNEEAILVPNTERLLAFLDGLGRRVRGADRLERLDRLHHHARRRSQPALPRR